MTSASSTIEAAELLCMKPSTLGVTSLLDDVHARHLACLTVCGGGMKECAAGPMVGNHTQGNPDP